MAPIAKWLNEDATRVPLTDWYDTKTGKQMGFPGAIGRGRRLHQSVGGQMANSA